MFFIEAPDEASFRNRRPWMSTGKNKVALVTGASSGIGTEIAWSLASRGFDLVLTGRAQSALDRIAADLTARHGSHVTTLVRDLAEADGPRRLVEEINNRGLIIDVLVNNAGLGSVGAFSDMAVEDSSRMIAVNILALTELTGLLLPSMVKRGHGRILNVGSVVGYQPGGPGMAVYFASKNYVLALSRALSRELEGTGVTLTVVSPGPVQTAFAGRSGFDATPVGKLVKPMDAKVVAEAAVCGLLAGRRTVIPGFLAKILAFAGELPPRSIALEINRLLFKH
jgi:uncharacterized protein